MHGRMRNIQKELEFLDVFDDHADEFFSYCVSRIPDRAEAQKILEHTFKRAWDEMGAGQPLRMERFYRLLDEAVNTRANQALSAVVRFFESFKGTVASSS